MEISRRSFLKKTTSSLAFGVPAGQGILRPIAAAAQAATETSEQRRQIETRNGSANKLTGQILTAKGPSGSDVTYALAPTSALKSLSSSSI